VILLVKCVATQTISSFAFPALFETGESSKFQSVVDSIRHDVINFIFEMEVAALYEMLAVTQLSAHRGVCVDFHFGATIRSQFYSLKRR
jgi:hypothetical protein